MKTDFTGSSSKQQSRSESDQEILDQWIAKHKTEDFDPTDLLTKIFDLI